jgi:hypothetical protein
MPSRRSSTAASSGQKQFRDDVDPRLTSWPGSHHHRAPAPGTTKSAAAAEILKANRPSTERLKTSWLSSVKSLFHYQIGLREEVQFVQRTRGKASAQTNYKNWLRVFRSFRPPRTRLLSSVPRLWREFFLMSPTRICPLWRHSKIQILASPGKAAFPGEIRAGNLGPRF